MVTPVQPHLLVEVLESPLLRAAGFIHGFATRIGGASRGCFDSLNLGRGLGDDPEALEENHRRLAARIGYERERLIEISQVHGDRIREVAADEPRLTVAAEEGDGLFTAAAGTALSVRTADCVPLLLADPRTDLVAAVHAGWRGVENHIALRAVEQLVAAGARAGDLVAAIGPHIRLASFEVGEEVAAQLVASHPERLDTVVDRSGPRPKVDLASILRAQLRSVGLTQIDDLARDTFAEPALFYSHRRDRGDTGRHLAVIVAR